MPGPAPNPFLRFARCPLVCAIRRATVRSTILAGSLLAAVVTSPAPPALAGDRHFETSTTFDAGSYPEGFYPHSSRSADLDGDGRPDFVTSNHWYPNNISVLFHDGADGFRQPQFVETSSSSNGVEIADFTGDGLPDILASNTGSVYQGNTVSLLRNLGGGSFAPHQVFPALTGPAEIAAADFDLDGDVDAAVAGYGSSGQGTQIAILLNDGDGGFLAPAILTVGPAPSDLKAGDLDGDGRPDLVVAREVSRVTVLMNTGGGTFASPIDYTVMDQPLGGDAFANVELGDIDRDGDLDVLYSSGRTQIDSDYGAVCIFTNPGNGTLGGRRFVAFPRYLGGASDMVLADVSGDAWLDLLSTHAGSGGWVAMLATGGGEFGPGHEYAGGNTPMKVHAEDADFDGDLDALVVNRYSLTLGVHRNLGDGTFLEPDGRDLEPLSSAMDAGDIDGDGDLDVVSSYAYAGGGGISVIRNQGDGTFGPRQIYAGPRGAMAPRLVDLDGDSDRDLVWAFDNTSPPYDFVVRLNNGAGGFGAAVIWAVGTCGTGDLQTMDVDQDGDADVLLTDWLGCVGIDSPWVWIRRNNGDATFGPPYRLEYSTSPHEMAVADFNGDGRQDLATDHADGVKIVIALGNGQFSPPAEYAGPDTPFGLTTGDWNTDGVPDVATVNMRGAWEGTISVFLNQGDGTLGTPTTIRSAFSTDVPPIGQLLAQDADGDGDDDLLLMSYGGQDLLVYESDGNGGFALQNRYVVGAAPGDFRCLDFTGDGLPDLGAVIGLPPSNLNRRFVVAAGIQQAPTDVDGGTANLSQTVALESRGPNPFREFTRLAFSLPERGGVRLTVHDVSGREVRRLLDGALSAGEHVVSWDGSGREGGRLSAGVYLARLSTDGGASTARVLLLR